MRAVAVALLLLLAAPELSISPSGMTFDAPLAGPNPAAKILTVRNEKDGNLDWKATSTASWLSTSPASGRCRAGESQDVEVRVDVAGLLAGDHSGSIQIHDPKASNSPRTTLVTLRLSAAPVIGVDPATLSFSAPFGGPDPAPRPLTIRNDGGGPLAWSLSDDAPWLSADPTSGAIAPGGSATVQVRASASGLASGPHTGTISVDGIGALNGPRTVGASIEVNAQPRIALTPATFAFSAPFGGPNPPAQSLEIENSGGGTLLWAAQSGAAWLKVGTASGSLGAGASASLALSVDVAGLADGVHAASVTVTAPGSSNSPRTATATLTINEEPRIGLNPSGLSFRLTAGGAPASRAVSLTNGGAGTLDWSADSGASWLSVEPASGSLGSASSEPLTLKADPSGLAEGSYTASVAVESSDASNSPQAVTVTLPVGLPAPADERRGGYACGLLGAEFLLLAPLLLRRRRR